MIYKDTLRVKNVGMISGEWTKDIPWSECRGIPVVDAFLEDNDIQEITVVSTNFGFVRTYTKQYDSTI